MMIVGAISTMNTSCRGNDAPAARDGAADAGARRPPTVELKVGDPAPPFALPGSDGKTYALADYNGKQVVVLAWFAKAFSSG